MEMLSREAVDRARAFVGEHGRPLERARFAQVVDGGPLEPVVEELTAFRADGGGFGGALEPDARTPEASVLAALTALDILRMHGAPGDHPLVAEICGWLADHAEADPLGRVVWPFLPPAAQSSPHAPWWDQAEAGQLAETFAGFLANPGLALTAHLFRHAAAAPAEAARAGVDQALLDALSEQALLLAVTGFPAEEVNAHDAAAHLVGEMAVPSGVRESWRTYLESVLPQRIMQREEEFAAYGIHPLWIAPTPDHPLAELVRPQIDLAADQVIASQRPDGSWEPFWDWGGWFPDDWAVARREWQGSLVVRNLAALRAWGRVEPA